MTPLEMRNQIRRTVLKLLKDPEAWEYDNSLVFGDVLYYCADIRERTKEGKPHFSTQHIYRDRALYGNGIYFGRGTANMCLTGDDFSWLKWRVRLAMHKVVQYHKDQAKLEKQTLQAQKYSQDLQELHAFLKKAENPSY